MYFLLAIMVGMLSSLFEGIVFTDSQKAILSILFCIIFLFPIIFIIWIRYHLAKKKSLKNVKFDRVTETQDKLQRIEPLLMHGRKTIATVMRVQYIPIDNALCEQNIKSLNLVAHQNPKFKVQYTFNPPDDSTPKDLVHEIIIDEAPESFLKVGDPLPILYRIHKNYGGDEIVDSIPFPIVLKDLDSLSYLIGQSVLKRS